MNKLEEAKNLLHKSANQTAKGLLGRVSCLQSLGEANDLFFSIRKAHDSKAITEAEHEAIMTVLSHVVTTGKLEPTLPVKEVSAIDVFRKRIWSTPDISHVMQFRNSVTDMLMLDFITLDEYVELNNEIDRYIQYTLSNGGMK